MSKLELFILIAVGFLVFEVTFIRIGFFFNIPIGALTIIFSYIIYCFTLAFLFSILTLPIRKQGRYLSLSLFVAVSLLLFGASISLSDTYDTSWDGQGYHQTAVIALANGWNPVLHPSIKLVQKLPSQIFAEGYPSALWEIEASIYSVVGRINAAKIVNFFIGIVSLTIIYSLLRKLLFNKIIAFLISFFLVIQPVYTIQLLTFMEDGFGYELLLIASAALVIGIISPKAYWSMGVFCLTEILLVSIKYSHLPAALILGFIFLLIVINRFLNHEYKINKNTKSFVIGFILLSIIFASLPYGRNFLTYGTAFYPTNIPDLMGSVTYNNVPYDLTNRDKLSLLFYGIFSKSQSAESGDPRSAKNIAELKLPFTFSLDEINDSASLYNNRVGGGGPLFSGIILVSFMILVYVSFKATTSKERYAVYTSYFCLTLIIVLSLLTPTPNLMRYVNQLEIIPFAILIPLYVVFKKMYIKIFTGIILILVAINTILFSAGVVGRNIIVTNEINEQFSNMRNSGDKYQVKAQHFYSSYIILTEQKIPFLVVDNLRCHNITQMVASSTTTQYCIK